MKGGDDFHAFCTSTLDAVRAQPYSLSALLHVHGREGGPRSVLKQRSPTWAFVVARDWLGQIIHTRRETKWVLSFIFATMTTPPHTPFSIRHLRSSLTHPGSAFRPSPRMHIHCWLHCFTLPLTLANVYRSCKKMLIYLCNRPWSPIGLRDVEAPTFSRKSAHRWRKGCQPYVLAAFYTPGRFLALISVRGWVDPRGHGAAGRIRLIEKSNDFIGIRTRDLPARSILPQPTTLPRAPNRSCTDGN
jgi:hypothetical protein